MATKDFRSMSLKQETFQTLEEIRAALGKKSIPQVIGELAEDEHKKLKRKGVIG